MALIWLSEATIKHNVLYQDRHCFYMSDGGYEFIVVVPNNSESYEKLNKAWESRLPVSVTGIMSPWTVANEPLKAIASRTDSIILSSVEIDFIGSKAERD